MLIDALTISGNVIVNSTAVVLQVSARDGEANCQVVIPRIGCQVSHYNHSTICRLVCNTPVGMCQDVADAVVSGSFVEKAYVAIQNDYSIVHTLPIFNSPHDHNVRVRFNIDSVIGTHTGCGLDRDGIKWSDIHQKHIVTGISETEGFKV